MVYSLLFVKLRNAANNNRQVAMGLYGIHSPGDVTMTLKIQFCYEASELSRSTAFLPSLAQTDSSCPPLSTQPKRNIAPREIPSRYIKQKN
jgi:hypothetical protein